MKGRRNKDSCVDNDRRRDPKWKQRRDSDPLPRGSRQQQSPPTRGKEWDPRKEEDAWDVEEGVEISEKEEAFLFNLEDKDETFGRWRSGEVDGRGRRACSAELCHGVTCDMTCKDFSCVPVQKFEPDLICSCSNKNLQKKKKKSDFFGNEHEDVF
jgi:hypothetical protein